MSAGNGQLSPAVQLAKCQKFTRHIFHTSTLPVGRSTSGWTAEISWCEILNLHWEVFADRGLSGDSHWEWGGGCARQKWSPVLFQSPSFLLPSDSADRLCGLPWCNDKRSWELVQVYLQKWSGEASSVFVDLSPLYPRPWFLPIRYAHPTQGGRKWRRSRQLPCQKYSATTMLPSSAIS